jgi:hypothetical protein
LESACLYHESRILRPAAERLDAIAIERFSWHLADVATRKGLPRRSIIPAIWEHFTVVVEYAPAGNGSKSGRRAHMSPERLRPDLLQSSGRWMTLGLLRWGRRVLLSPTTGIASFRPLRLAPYYTRCPSSASVARSLGLCDVPSLISHEGVSRVSLPFPSAVRTLLPSYTPTLQPVLALPSPRCSIPRRVGTIRSDGAPRRLQPVFSRTIASHVMRLC